MNRSFYPGHFRTNSLLVTFSRSSDEVAEIEVTAASLNFCREALWSVACRGVSNEPPKHTTKMRDQSRQERAGRGETNARELADTLYKTSLLPDN